MALAIDTVNGCGLSNKVYRELLPKTKIRNTVLVVHLSLKTVLPAV